MSDTDPHDLARFVAAQQDIYPVALDELRRGRKETHWMWFVFPQIAGLGTTEMARRYAIGDLDEARAYIAHPVLGPRLRECAEAVLATEGSTPEEILGYPDCLKLQSSATLFDLVSPPGSVFQRVLDRCYGGEPCERTIAAVQRGSGAGDGCD